MSPFLFALLALDMGSAARESARAAAAAVGREPIAFTFRNISSVGPAEAADIRRLFESELRAAGVRFTEAASSGELRLTISEEPVYYLLIAEVRRGDERRVLLESWPRAPAQPSTTAGELRLDRKLLWQDTQPILDAAVSGDLTVVLEPARVLVSRGTERQSAPIPETHPYPRDIRGRLSVGDSVFTAWLPGTACRGRLQPQLTIECRESQDPWLLAPGAIAPFARDRNIFTGRVVIGSWGAQDLAPFYSAASAEGAWVFAGVDGRARVYTSGWQAAGQLDGWGSDIAGIQSPCGERILAAQPGNDAEMDSVRPYKLIEGGAAPAGPALEFAGPVTALWSAGAGAVAVSRDLQTGRYAAFSLVPACGA